MKQIKKGISWILVIAMIVSMFTVGIVSSSAASARLRGDANNDGIVDIGDCTYIQMALARMIDNPATGKKLDYNKDLDHNSDDFRAADVNSDGTVDIGDVTLIQMALAHMSQANGYGIKEPLDQIPTEPDTQAPETQEPDTQAPQTQPDTEPETSAPVGEGYYLAGSVNGWKPADGYKFELYKEEDNEYKLANITFAAGDEFKAAYTADGETFADEDWYPTGMGNNYVVEKAGTYNVYFRPDGNGNEDWHEGTLYIRLVEEPSTEEPATSAPAGDEGFYLAGTVNGWKPADGYKFELYKEEDNEYKLANVTFAAGDEFKAAYSADGKTFADEDWYPTGMGNNYVVEKAGTYNVYFRPDGNGNEDWHEGTLYIRLVDEPSTDTPSTEEPATAAPAGGEGFYLAGTVNGWKPADGYKFELYKEEDNEYKLANITFAAGDEFKAAYTKDGKTFADEDWYPTGMGNNYVVEKAGTYNVYFRPDGNGNEDWHEGTLYIRLVDEPSTDTPSTDEPATSAPAGDEGFYLAGTVNGWKPADGYKFELYKEEDNEYKLANVTFAAGDEFKAAYSTDGKTFADEDWYPTGMGNNYVVEKAGTYNVYFRPDGNGNEDWHEGTLYIRLVDEPSTDTPSTEEPATSAPSTAKYFLVGSFNEWNTKDTTYAFELYKEDENEYKLAGVALEKNDEFKVVDADGKWYPDGMGNNYVVEKAGTYNVYFRPDGNGNEDWHEGTLYIRLVDEPSTDTPSTDEPATSAPAGDEGFYLAGTVNGWKPADGYKFELYKEEDNEYKLANVTFAAGDEFKAAYSADGKTFADEDWYPTGMGNNYVVEKAGTYNVYFRPDGNGNEDWHEGTLYIRLVDEPSTDTPSTEEPATSAPAGDEGFYLAGTVNGWKPADGYKFELYKEEDNEYKLANITFAAGDEFKAAYTKDGKTFADEDWYPTGMGNNYVVEKAGTYNVYFRPDGNGNEDWHEGTLYIRLVDEPSTDTPSTEEPATSAPAGDEGFYLAGTVNGWKPADGYKFELYKEEDNEYKLANVTFAAGDEFKAAYTKDGKTFADEDWYPTGMGNNYVVEKAGTYNVYFRPDGNGNEDWHEGTLYIRLAEEPSTEEPATGTPSTEEPATAAPSTAKYFLVGSFNEWNTKDTTYAFELYKEDDNEYKLAGVELAKDAEFKVVDAEGKWYPDNYDNYKVTEAGTYNIYFRPNGNGNEDWHAGVIYASKQSAPATETPATETPATTGDETVAPSTEEPATAAPSTAKYFLVGSFNEWNTKDTTYAFELYKEDDNEYKLAGVELAKDAEFKVVDADGKWYPDNYDNYKVTEAGTYNIYFRPNGNGNEDWHAGVIYASKQSAPATEAPATEAPATETPATETPATQAPATEAPATAAPSTAKYFLVGSFNEWNTKDTTYAFELYKEDDNEYKLAGVELAKDAEFKVVDAEGKWYPDNYDNYKVTEAGTYNIYFRPNGNGNEDWHAGVIYASKQSAPATETPATTGDETVAPSTEEPATAAPSTAKYFLVGSFNEWNTKDTTYAFELYKEDDNEYKLAGVELAKDAEFKVVDAEGKWYPDNYDNYKVTEAGTYNIYFRPNGNGNEDWHAGVIYASKQSAPATETPATEAPATEAPATEAPATEAPVTAAPSTAKYFLVGSFNEWNTKDTTYAFELYKEDDNEYKLAGVELAKDAEFKVVDAEGKWYPDNYDNYKVTEAGTYNIYFRPNGNGNEDWHAGVIYASKQSAPATETPATEAPATEAPATEAPATETPATEAPATAAPSTAKYFLVGSFNEWNTKDTTYAFELYKEDDNEYKLAGVELAKNAEFKVVDAEGKWYPDNYDNYKVTEAGTYNIYFRPNGNGNEDWHAGVIYASKQSAPATETPVTEAPETQAPETEAPATEAPAADKTIYVSNGLNWNEINVYAWNATGKGGINDWPGMKLTEKVGKNDLDQDIYKAVIPGEYNAIIFNNGGTAQTVDITEGVVDGAAFWISNETDSAGHYQIGTWKYDPTEAPATEAPATEAPETQAPATEAPATEAPATEAPVTEAPETQAPATEEETVTYTYTYTITAPYKIISFEAYVTFDEDVLTYDSVIYDGKLSLLGTLNPDEESDPTVPGLVAMNYSVSKTKQGIDITDGVRFITLYLTAPASAQVEAPEMYIVKIVNGESDESILHPYNCAYSYTWTFGDTTKSGEVAQGTVVEKPAKAQHYNNPTEAVETTAPATEAPETTAPATKTYYLVGTFTNWETKDEYALTLTNEEENEYSIKDVDLAFNAEFKVKDSDGNWYPDNYDNYKVDVAGTYDIYFRPNGNGNEDWYQKVLYGAKHPDPETQAPATEAPATQAPATQAPATQAPATQAPAANKVYLNPGVWNKDGARFAAYFFGNGEKWVSMTKVSDAKYEVEVPDGYTSVIFCRMNGSTTDNNWNNKWNQTSDLTLSGNIGKTYSMSDWSNGSWG